ncbi:mitochondrial zinc maintenance protein 1, mitochondrial [Lipomyces arxii]|uniref:mitochondrial zinc maintenance protein 1, mitochondrial n=1 Tax=Lipomyces arxii TaxID=56418 RepID=UPI0034CDDD99
MSRSIAVLSTYRNLLRATRVAFENDTRLLLAARQQARDGFEAGKRELSGNDADLEEIDRRLEHAVGVALVLRTNVVQGERTKKDEDEDVYKLRIHKYTEMGDNESVKGGKSNLSGTQKRVRWDM